MKIIKDIKPIIEIDVSQIFIELHNIALENSQLENYVLINSAVIGDNSQEKFTGTGKQVIQVILKDSNGVVDKNKCLNILQNYLKFYINFKDTLTDNDIFPIYRKKITNNESVYCRNTKLKNLFGKQTNISFLVNKLFESTQEHDEEIAKQNNSVLIGYQLGYGIETATDTNWKKRILGSVKNYAEKKLDLSKDNISGIYNSVVNSISTPEIGLKFSSLWGGGGGEVSIGGKKLNINLDYKSINANDLVSAVKTNFAIDKGFPGITPEITVIDSKSLISYFKDNKELKTKLSGINLSLVIKIIKNNKSYNLINKKSIAKIVNSSIEERGLGKITGPNKISQDQIVYINNYDNTSNDQNIDSTSNNTNSNKNSTSLNETEQILTLLNIIFEKQANKHKKSFKDEQRLYNSFYKDDNIKLNVELKNKLIDDKNKSDLQIEWSTFNGSDDNSKYKMFKTIIDSAIKDDGSIDSSSFKNLTVNQIDALISVINKYKSKIDAENKTIDDLKTDLANKNNKNETKYDAYIIPMKHLTFKTVKKTDKSNKES